MSSQLPHKPPVSAQLAVALAASLWGTWSLFLRHAERAGAIAPAVEVFVAMGAVMVFYLPSALRAPWPRGDQRRLIVLIVLGGLVDGVNNLCFFSAMQHTTVAVAVVTHYLTPLLVIVLATPLLKERFPKRGWQAVIIALLGLWLLLRPWESAAGTAWLGAALGAASAVFYALNVIICRSLQSRLGATQTLVYRLPFALLVLAPFIPKGGFVIAPHAWGWLGAGILLPGLLGAWLFFRGLAKVPANLASVLTLLEPLIATLVGTLAFGEKLPWISCLGGALVLAGAGLALTTPAPKAASEPQ